MLYSSWFWKFSRWIHQLLGISFETKNITMHKRGQNSSSRILRTIIFLKLLFHDWSKASSRTIFSFFSFELWTKIERNIFYSYLLMRNSKIKFSDLAIFKMLISEFWNVNNNWQFFHVVADYWLISTVYHVYQLT